MLALQEAAAPMIPCAAETTPPIDEETAGAVIADGEAVGRVPRAAGDGKAAGTTGRAYIGVKGGNSAPPLMTRLPLPVLPTERTSSWSSCRSSP